MPELPEVEIARRNLLRWFDGRRVVRAEADKRARTFRGADPGVFEEIQGRLESAFRRGKYLMLFFESGRGALAHLGMTGKFVRRPIGHVEPYSRARFHLDDGQVIHYRDPRLFGRIEPVPSEALPELPVVRALGIDPMVAGPGGGHLQTGSQGRADGPEPNRRPRKHPRGRGAVSGAPPSLAKAGHAPPGRVAEVGARDPLDAQVRAGERGRGGDRIRGGARRRES